MDTCGLFVSTSCRVKDTYTEDYDQNPQSSLDKIRMKENLKDFTGWFSLVKNGRACIEYGIV